MRQHIVALSAALVLVGGCWGAPPNAKILTQQCETLFSEPDLARQAASNLNGVSIEDFCGCYGQTASAEEGALVDLHKEVLLLLNNTVETEGITVEDAAKMIEAKVESGEVTSFTERELDDVGDYLQDVAERIANNNGVCAG